MRWSKQAQPEAVSFSPSFSSTGTIDSPVETPASGPSTSTYPAISPGTERAPKRETTSNDDLRLDAVIEGPISLKCARLFVAETAKATVDVAAREIIVHGELHGHLQASERIEIKRNASVMAELITPRLAIDPGAYFKGTVQIERRKKPRAATA